LRTPIEKMLYIVGLGSAAFMAPGSQVASSKVMRASRCL